MLGKRWSEELGKPVEPYSIVAFRIAFGLIMLWEVYRYLSKGWVYDYWIDLDFHFTYPGFHWVRPWPGDGMELHFYALGLLALLIAAGAAYRAAATLFFLGFTYVFLLERAQYLNHFYLICLVSFLLILIPAHCAFSVDALLRPRVRRQTIPAWTVWLLRFQIAIPYVYGGVAKLDADWLRGEPMRGWMSRRTDFPIVGRWFTEEWMVYGASGLGLAFDLLVVPGLLWRRTRPYAFAAAVLFHLTNARLFSLGIFPWFMIAATTIFFEPDWPRRLRRLPRPPVVSEPRAPLRSSVVALLAVYAAVQLLVPLRHLVYPGPPNWTEEGHTFAWHMKLRNKKGRVKFYAVDQATGGRERLHHAEYLLSERQLDKMAMRPYMIQQYARHLADDLRRRGHDGFEIRVDARASLNGREYQALIDPSVDLAAQPVSLRHATWIMPLRTPLVRQPPRGVDAVESSA